MRIVPAIDLIDGKCVRLTNGDFNERTVYSCDPVRQAQFFQSLGFGRLHLVDLDGAKTGIQSPAHLKILSEIAATTSLIIDYSGGISSAGDVHSALNSGAAKVMIGSLAVRNPQTMESILTECGAEKIILAADVRDEKVLIRGWQEESEIGLLELIAWFAERGGSSVMVTDVTRDGLLQGVQEEIYRTIKATFPEITLIASGGVGDESDIRQLSKVGTDEVVVGKALYESRIEIEKVQECIW